MKILITGATGFLGSALAFALANSEHKLFLLTRPQSNLSRINNPSLLEQVRCCNSDKEIKLLVHEIQPEIVIHNACSYGRLGEDAIELVNVNIKLGLLIIQALIKNDKPSTFINTGTILKDDVSFYAISKNQFSQWGEVSARKSLGILRFINLRLQHMYGPGDSISKFTTYVLHSCHQNITTLELSPGKQKRDFIYIDDVVSAFLILISKKDELDLFVNIDVGSGVSPTIQKFVRVVHKLTKSKTQLIFGALEYRDNEPMLCRANTKVMQSFGWKPQYDLEAGLLKMIEIEFK